MKKKRFSVGQIVRALKQAEVGVPVVVVIREAGIGKQAFYQWEAKYIGLEVARLSNTIPSVNLTINVGSSGLKFFLYRMRHSATEVDPDGVREAGANWLGFSGYTCSFQ
jgi:hypothetical protein